MQFARLLPVVCLSAVLLAAKIPLTHEMMWKMKRVSAPVVSPDGKWVVFTVVEPSYEEAQQVTDLWLVAADATAKPRRLTTTKSPESAPTWSPDGRKLAFSAKREGDENNQIYVINVAEGGEAVRVTSAATGASSPRWSPDGKWLMFTSSVYANASDDETNKKIAAERKARKSKARIYDSFPIRFWDKWLDDARPHLFVQVPEPGAKARDLLAGTQLAAAPGFAGTETMSGQEIVAVWAPDSRSVVFAATLNRNQAAFARVNTHLYHVDLNGGEPRPITSGRDSYSRPMFAHDGRTLYCLYSRDSDRVYSHSRLAMFAWPSPGERTSVTGSLDRSVGSFAIAADSKQIYLTAEDAGLEKLYVVAARGGEVKQASMTAAGVYSSLTSPAKAATPFVIGLWESSVNPAELVRIEVGAKEHRYLTDFNRTQAAGIEWRAPEHFWFTSKRGKKIHNMIVLPPGFDKSKKYPLFVLMHGGPHNMWRDQITLRWNYHLLASPGYVLLLTNYTGSTGFGEQFAQEIQGDPLKGPAEEIHEAADEAIKRFSYIDASRQAAGGASYGGHLANWMQATTTRYKCLISHAGLINLESQWGTSDSIYHRELNNGGPVWEQGSIWREQNPIRYAKNFKTPMLLTVGENDYRVPLNQTLENWSVHQRLQVPSRLIVFPEANHWITKGEDSRLFYQEVHAWLAKHLN